MRRNHDDEQESQGQIHSSTLSRSAKELAVRNIFSYNAEIREKN